MLQRLATVPHCEMSRDDVQEQTGRHAAKIADVLGNLNEADLVLVLVAEAVEAPGPVGVGLLLLSFADVDDHVTLEEIQETSQLLPLRNTNLKKNHISIVLETRDISGQSARLFKCLTV